MALTIKHENNTFLVVGTINVLTVKQFKNHLEFLLSYNKILTINIDGVTEIDSNGMRALRDLQTTALIKKKVFSIVGFGCKEIYDDFQLINAA